MKFHLFIFNPENLLLLIFWYESIRGNGRITRSIWPRCILCSDQCPARPARRYPPTVPSFRTKLISYPKPTHTYLTSLHPCPLETFPVRLDHCCLCRLSLNKKYLQLFFIGMRRLARVGSGTGVQAISEANKLVVSILSAGLKETKLKGPGR